VVNNSIREEEKMKPVPAGNKGLAKLPKNVRNKMGYMNKGGMAMKCNCGKGGMCNCGKSKTKMAYGGMAKKKPVKMNKGGYCGASNPPARPMKKGK
jgi:hypothetical protein